MKKLILLLKQLFCRHKYQYTEINHNGTNTVECKYCGKRKTVKVSLSLLAFIFVICGIYGCTNYRSRGPLMPFDVPKGSIRITETNEYIATEVCVMLDGKTPVWKLESIQKKN